MIREAELRYRFALYELNSELADALRSYDVQESRKDFIRILRLLVADIEKRHAEYLREEEAVELDML